MEVKQIYQLVNTATSEALGSTDLTVNEDLSNLVDIGTAVFNASAMDNFVKSLVDHIGKMVFVARVYKGELPYLMRDAWEYGSVCEKVRCELPEATENKSWDLTNGTSYDTNIFTKPTVSVKFFNSLTTFDVPVSVAEKQLKSAFSNVQQMNSFLSMIYTGVENSIKIKNDEMARRTIANFIGETFYDLSSAGTYTGTSGTKAVNLLYLYNSAFGTSLTKAKAITDKDFLRFASITIRKYINRLKTMSVLFNIGDTKKFTPVEDQHLILLSDFAENVNGYLYSDTFNKENVELPGMYEKINYWQGTGTDYAIGNTSKISVTTSNEHTVTADYIVGVLFDKEALGISNFDKRVKTHNVERSEFTNLWYKTDAAYWNDFDENFVVFYLA